MSAIHPFDPVVDELALADRTLSIIRPRDPLVHPYWAKVWPGSLILADELLRRDLRGVRVLELGCGLGIGAIAACLAGAEAVATDIDEDALLFARENGRRVLGRELETMILDLKAIGGAALAPEARDLVVAAEVLYNADLVAAVAGGLERLVSPGGEAMFVHAIPAQADGLRDLLGWPADRWAAGARHVMSLRRPA